MTILELRQYTLHPGRRDELIELFEREFVESQEELGAQIVGTFRDVRDPDRFVWVRGFSDMPARRAALAGFYGGPVWKRHRDAANATMVDFDDVLLLEPVGSGFPDAPRVAVGAGRAGPSRVLVVVRTGDGVEAAADDAESLLGVRPVVARTAPYANDFPALPVRDEQAVVWFASFPAADALGAARERLDTDPSWQAAAKSVQVLELEPTARSALR
ncbi:quinol monooxygenase YgiN [Pseudonocardia hierapolitana]|uniref:Quinol monooxygenase YgiN n=1 Tax=Pseudonocardia hierapolitana TaxID=1128676 RepID=A0A561SPP3_9PSEU|nr:NIPSNAP family protein [Pseudonocardia hierapolitana]TWF76835.1 quinol monooxygenase YgiN [Pseudonocardia hierapolitana]